MTPRGSRGSRRRWARERTLLAAAAGLALAWPAAAHNLAPAYLELRELGDGAVAVRWKESALTPRGTRLAPSLPCPDASEPAVRFEADAVLVEWRLACAASLVGQRVAVSGLAGSGTDVLLHVELADGRSLRAILTERAPALAIPGRERAVDVLASYARLGVTHLWTGLDHVIFVAGLTLLLGATRRLVVATTAFTAGHSVTLALASLGVVHAPQALVEVAIAGTIVALAVSLAQAREAGSSSARAGIAGRPALLPFAFGLLHGLGFAGALGALGLPQHAIPLALFSFNVGIELGQLALVGLLLGGGLAAARVHRALSSERVRTRAHEAAATAIGALGVFWCLERAAGWLFP
jgi:predicted RecA/RadA family phage recombinase